MSKRRLVFSDRPSPTSWSKHADPLHKRGVILSETKDPVSAAVANRLRKEFFPLAASAGDSDVRPKHRKQWWKLLFKPLVMQA